MVKQNVCFWKMVDLHFIKRINGKVRSNKE